MEVNKEGIGISINSKHAKQFFNSFVKPYSCSLTVNYSFYFKKFLKCHPCFLCRFLVELEMMSLRTIYKMSGCSL